MKMFSFIIVNYNGLELLKDLIGSLNTLTISESEHAFFCKEKEEDVFWEAIFFDNGSTDGSVEFLRHKCRVFKNFKVIESKENTGFGHASNEAAKKADSDFLIFLNPDTKLKTRDLGILVKFIKSIDDNDNMLGVLGAKTLNEDGSLQYSCRAFPTIARQFYESFFLAKIFKKSRVFGSYFMTWWDHKNSVAVDWITGSFMLIRKDLFFELKGFDEEYFMYSEDTDLCLRLSKKGYINYYLPDFKIMHLDSAIALRNRIKREKEVWKSRRLYFKKNYSEFHARTVSYFYFCGMLNRTLLFFLGFLFTFKRKHIIKAGNYFKIIMSYLSGR